MFGQTALGSSRLSGAENRMFRYEVEGMRQTYESDQLGYPIRTSGSFYITVPYSRMNDEMQRILRMGGNIVSIQPVTLDGDSTAKMQAATANQNLEAKGKSKATGAQQTTQAKSNDAPPPPKESPDR
ncbi:phycobilisome linker polypeptide [Myxacorys almedinensis]|uniref:CpcD phycobilisome linker protein n=1 Tax=Myxacorys almedinensis A TaxID=2690445 RepID=A0A8J8CLX1_9CYAN|nr:phycobilisome linker polypeptide [Myxacorys almedinensis]NDJ18185.1 CpcD phycobilisome linker protein [Myxacorys almedinensis A]